MAQRCCPYLTTNEYQQTANSQANTTTLRQPEPKTSTIHQDACIEALDDFAATIWPHGMDDLMFSEALTQKLAANAARINSVDKLKAKRNPLF